MADRTGQQLGNYQLVRLLGKGGFAEVYLGQHRFLSQRQVAIKILSVRLNAQDGVDFQREANQLAALKHPHIVPLLDFSVQEEIPYLVMDYCPGGTLRRRHPRGTRLPLPQVLSYVQQMAQALDYAHTQRVIHRDVKPENMLVGQAGEILLSDFGVATMVHSTSSMSAQAPSGTIPYMAPEQIQSQARPASDQYALGIVAYEWLSGICPFEGSFSEIFAKHLMAPPPPLRTQVPDLPPAVDEVLLTVLAKEPKSRFATVQAFANALSQAANPAAPSIRPKADLPLPAASVPSILSLTAPTVPVQPAAPPNNTPQPPPTHTNPDWFTIAPTKAVTPLPALQEDATVVSMRQDAHAWTPPLSASQEDATVISTRQNVQAWTPPSMPHPPTPHPPIPPAPQRRSSPLVLILACVVAILLIGGVIASVFASGVLGSRNPQPTATTVVQATTIPTQAPTIAPTQAPTTVITPTPSPSQLAQAVIQRYYDDINQKNYLDAYQQWGANYQNGQTSDQFAAGFANTLKDDISFDQITPQSDGTVRVQMTINATEQSPSGPVAKVFQGYYIVGQENGAWKLLSAHFQQMS